MTEIPCIIPYKSNGRLDEAYNDEMKIRKGPVYFQDHDVLQLNPYWYQALQHAWDTLGEKIGFLSFVTNRIGPRCQRSDHPELRRYEFGHDPDDIKLHMQIAADRWRKYKFDIRDVTDVPAPGTPMSGITILTHKKAWEAAGGFPHGKNGFAEVDWRYSLAVKKAGFRWYTMRGVVVFHTYKFLKRDPIRKIPFDKL